MAPDDDQASSRSRASKACKRCNQKRVKCDALEVGQPCSRCQRGGHDDCALITSRRGQYSRKRAASSDTTGLRQEREGERVSPLASASTTTPGDRQSARPTDDVTSKSGRTPGSGQQAQSTPQLSDLTPDATSTYRDVSWATAFNHFLDSRQNHQDTTIDKCSITYLGESFPLALVLEDLREGGRLRLHHPGPPIDASDSPYQARDNGTHPAHLPREDIQYLEAKHAFEYPPNEVYDGLIDVFLNRFWPLYSLVNRQEFIKQYETQQLPWMLVHACCFVAATFCPEALIHRIGFPSRKEARLSYYKKAKALFDVGYEGNKIVVLQSAIMLSYWGGGPNDYWNFYSWIGTGVTIAERLGIHRSTVSANMPAKDRSLLKRLWWILVVRDASCSTLVGLPFRINMDHGDAEMMTLQDFEYDAQSPDYADHPLRSTFAHYQIQVARLSLILYQVDFARFIPRTKTISMAQVWENLQTWRREIPPELEWDIDIRRSNLLATSLSIIYDHHVMLATVGTTVIEAASTDEANTFDKDNLRQLSDSAAQRISTLASSVVTSSQSLRVPHETYQGVFLAGVVGYVKMRSMQPPLAQLGRLILDNCKMVMHDVKEAWDPAPWVTTLFEKLIYSLPPQGGDGTLPLNGFSMTSGAGYNSEFDQTLMGYGVGTPWQSNPMLTALFDFPQGPLAF